MEGTGAEVEFYQYVISIIWKAVHVCLGALSWLLQCVSGCWDYVTSLFKKRTKAMLVVGCIPIAVFFPNSSGLESKICSSGSSATSRLYCWYFVTLARLLLLPCYYPYKKQTILYIAADNFLDHDLILFRIYIYRYSASGGVLEGDDGLLSGWD